MRHLAPYVLGAGHDVTVYGRRSPLSAATSEDTVDGIRVRSTLAIERKSLSTLSIGMTATYDILAVHNYDVALILNVANGYFMPLLRRAGIPACVNVDGIEWKRGKWGVLGKSTFYLGAWLTAYYAAELIADSRALQPYWRDRFGRSSNFIPYGAHIRKRGSGIPLLRAHGLPTSGFVLAVARVAPENNLDLLLDAVEIMRSSAEVIVVGSGNYGSATATRLRGLDNSGLIRWMGHINDPLLLDALWCNAGVYWHGHSVGGTNPALLQALGCGAPTVALDTEFNREVLRASENLVGSDPRRLAIRLTEVLSDHLLAERMSRRGHEIVDERYSWHTVCQDYLNLLVTTAAKASSRHGR